MKLIDDEEFVLTVVSPELLELISSSSDEFVNVSNNE